MIKALLELFKALYRLALVLSLYSAIYGGIFYVIFGFISLLGPAPLSIQKSLVCGLIILLAQNVYILIKKGF